MLYIIRNHCIFYFCVNYELVCLGTLFLEREEMTLFLDDLEV